MRRSRLPRHRRALTRALTVLSLVSVPAVADPFLATPAFGVGPYTITGEVYDLSGRPLANVTIFDGSASVVTGSDGTFLMTEASSGTYTLRASRSVGGVADVSPISKSVTFTSLTDFGPKNVRFDLAFQAFNSSPTPLSLATSDKTLSVTITSRAPSPSATGGAGTSCVTVTDVRTGESSAATLGSVSGVNSTWSWSTPVTQATSEGTYNLKYRVHRCDTGATLVPEKLVTYVVDSSAPSVDVLLPADGTTTAYTQQPLLAKFNDTGASGISSSSIQFTLKDETAGTTTTYGIGAVNYNSTTKWAKTAPIPLVPGHDYTASVFVRDGAANSTTRSHTAPASGGGFRVTSVTVEPTYGSIADTACTLGPVDVATATREATCNDVPLHLEATTAQLGEARSAGWGAIVHELSLVNAQVVTSAGNVDIVGQPAWANEAEAPDVPKILQPFRVTASATPQTAVAGQLNLNLGTLKAKVPAAWQNARIRMVTADTVASPAPCADPAAVSEACSPNPVAIDIHGGYDPIGVEEHVAPCDAALTHKQPAVIAPNATKNVTFTVDPAAFTPEELNFHYRTPAGVFVVTQPGTSATTYTFQLPAVAEGTVVNYWLEAIGTFTSRACGDHIAAVAPSNHSYTTLATADATKDNDDFRAVLSTFDYIAGTQPALLKPGGRSATSAIVCGFFTAPTPCDLMSDASGSEETPRQTTPQGVAQSVGSGGGMALTGCGDLVVSDSNYWWLSDVWTSKTNYDSNFGSNEYRARRDPTFTAADQFGKVEQETFNGHTHLHADAYAGFTFYTYNPVTDERDTDRHRITIRYELLGKSHAYAEARAGTVIGFLIPFVPDNDAEGKVSGYTETYFREWAWNQTQDFGRLSLKGARAGTEVVQSSVTNDENHQRVVTFDAYLTEREKITIAAHAHFDIDAELGAGAMGTAEASLNYYEYGWLHVFDVRLSPLQGDDCY